MARSLMKSLRDHRIRCNRYLEWYRHAKETTRKERKALRRAEEGYRSIVLAQELLQTVAQKVQERAHRQIAGVVTRALRAAGFDYTFEIRFNRKRGKTEAELIFRRGELVFENPVKEVSGGACEVASFALRLACLLLQRPKLNHVLFLDEPFKNVNGEENQERVARMVEMLATEMGVQILMVSDDDWLALGKVIPLD